jgi:uncharacterized repeat protein (TIGR01451 family)
MDGMARIGARAAALLAATIAAGLSAVPASADVTPGAGEPPGISISVQANVVGVQGHRTVVYSQDEVRYQVTVHNNSGVSYPNAVITQSMSHYMTYVSTHPAAYLAGTRAVWFSKLPAYSDTSMSIETLVATLQPGTLKKGEKAVPPKPAPLVTTICLQASSGDTQLACGSSTLSLAFPAPEAKPGAPFWKYATVGGAAIFTVVGFVMLAKQLRADSS